MSEHNDGDGNEPVNDGDEGEDSAIKITRRRALQTGALLTGGAVASTGPGPVPATVGSAEAALPVIGVGVKLGGKAVSAVRGARTARSAASAARSSSTPRVAGRNTPRTSVRDTGLRAAGSSTGRAAGKTALKNKATWAISRLGWVAGGVGVAGYLSGDETRDIEDYLDAAEEQREVNAVQDALDVKSLRGTDSTTGLSARDISEKFGVEYDDDGAPDGTVNPQKAGFADLISQEVRVAVAEARANDLSKSEAVSVAQDVIDIEATSSVIELLEWTNGFTRALIDPAGSLVDAETGTVADALTIHRGSLQNRSLQAYADRFDVPVDEGDWPSESQFNTLDLDIEWDDIEDDEPLDYVDATGLVYETNNHDHDTYWSLPASIEDIDYDDEEAEGPQPAVILGLGIDPSDTWDPVLGVEPPEQSAFSWPAMEGRPVEADHDDLDGTVIYAYEIASIAVQQVADVYDEWTAELNDLVDALWDEFAAGEITPEDVISIGELIEEYDEADSLSRFKLELAKISESAQDINLEVTFTHEDFGGGDTEVTGHLGINYEDDADEEARDLVPGGTVEPEDYSTAYAVIEPADGGEPETRILSGEHPIDIIDIETSDDTPGSDEVEDDLDDSVNDSFVDAGEVVIQTDESLDVLEHPRDYAAGIEVTDTTGDAVMVNPAAFEETSDDGDGREYRAATPDLADGDADLSAVDLASYSGRISHDGELTDVDDIEEQLEEIRRLRKELERERQDQVLGGAAGGSEDRTILMVILAAVAGALGALGLGAANGGDSE